MNSMRSAAAVMAAGLGVVACENAARQLGPDLENSNGDPFGLANMTRESPDHIDSPFGCAVSFRTPQGPFEYAYKHITIGIPSRDLAPDGSSVRYAMRVATNGGTPVASAYCLIPNTPKAIAFLDRNIAHRTGATGRANLLEEQAKPSLDVTPPQGYLLDPVITRTEPAEYWGNFGSSWDEPGWESTSQDTGGGENWDYNPDLVPPPGCALTSDSTRTQPDTLCVQPFSHRDSALIADALQNRLTPLDGLRDSTLRDHCATMAEKFNALYAATDPPRVLNSAYNLISPENNSREWSGVYSAGDSSHPYDVIVIMPWLLDSAATSPKWKAELANSLLHEAAHVLGHDHSETEKYYLLSITPGPQYISDWFKDLNWEPDDGATCIAYPRS